MDKRLEALKAAYESVPIPKELDTVVEQALQTQPKHKRKQPWAVYIAAAAAVLLFTISVNISPALASTLSDIPVIGKVIEVITFTEIKDKKNNSTIDIKTPAITGLGDKKLENSLNEKYVKASKELYAQFEASMDELKADEHGNTAVTSGYDILTNNQQILSLRRYTETTQASSYTESQYDTVDKQNKALLTLPSLFKNDRYITIISAEIKKQMQTQMKQDNNKVYFLEKDEPAAFKQISKEQDFYITPQGKLIIAFDEYEVAPGYMGEVQFEIPTNVITDVLVGNRYIH